MSVTTFHHQKAKEILETHGLQRIADELCRQKNLETMQDIGSLTDAVIDALAWLKQQQRVKLKALCEACRQGNPDKMKEIADDRLREMLAPIGFQYARMEALLRRMKQLSQ